MQLTIYKCNQCNKEIGLSKHISLRLSQNSGIAIPPKTNEYWKTVPSLNGSFLHFCDPECLKKYFANLFTPKKK